MLIFGYSRRGNGCICRFKALKKFALKGSESLLGDIAEALENVEWWYLKTYRKGNETLVIGCSAILCYFCSTD